MSSSTYRAFIGRVSDACRADTRISAAFIGGSRGSGTADEHADIDLYLIIRDDAYDDFFAGRRAFMEQLGDPVFLEDFDGFGRDMLLFIYTSGVEGELVLGRESGWERMPSGEFLALVDRHGILPPQPFPPIKRRTETEQASHLRWLLHWYWRDLSQLSRWIARGKLWSAYAHLDMMRHACIDLACQKHDFTGLMEGYHKLEGTADAEDLAALQRTFCRVERAAMLDAVRSLLEIYGRLAPPLAAAHGIAYPAALHAVVIRRLEEASGESFAEVIGDLSIARNGRG